MSEVVKVGDYVEMLKAANSNPQEFHDKVGKMGIMLLQELTEEVEQEDPEVDESLIPIIKRIDSKYQEIVKGANKVKPRDYPDLPPDGFRNLFKQNFPDTYKFYINNIGHD